MERAVELYAAIQFLIIGLSHIVQPRVWVEFFIVLREKGRVGVFANGFLSLLFGSLVVSFHNVWTGWAAVLTLIGWAQVVKAAVSFIAPAYAMRSLQRVSVDRAWEFQVPGVIFVGLGGLMLFLLMSE